MDRLTTFDHDGLSFEVIDTGPLDGPVIIALHGFPQRGSCWAGVTPLLAAAGYRVLAPDQRGYSPGARPGAIEAYRMDRLGGDVLALADAAGARSVHVLGHDWGGAVAWYLGSRHADRVRTLSVASTPHPRAMITAMRGSQALRSYYMALFQIPKLPELLLRVRDGALLRRWLGSSAHSTSTMPSNCWPIRSPRRARSTGIAACGCAMPPAPEGCPSRRSTSGVTAIWRSAGALRPAPRIG